jgi:transcriptional regulator with XRE-family HTH domain
VTKTRKPRGRGKVFEREFARFQQNFGAVVKQLRLKAKLSRKELALRAKFSVSTLIHIEQGHGNPTLIRMEDLAAALKHRLSYIFQLAQDREVDEETQAHPVGHDVH